MFDKAIKAFKENETNQKIALWIKAHEHDLRVVGGVLIFIAIFSLVLSFFNQWNNSPTIFFSLLSSLCMASPHYAQWVVPEKLVRDMTFDEILQFIVSTDPKSDWHGVSKIYSNEVFLKKDPRLRFRAKFIDDGIHSDNFIEEWANRHPDSKARSYWHDLYYDGNLIDRFILVSVDGGRADLPPPEFGTKKVSSLKYRVAQINDTSDRLDEYLRRSGLEIEQEA